MKKILFLFMVMVLGAFASPLFAVDSTKVGCATSKSQAVEGVEFIKLIPSDICKVSAIRPDNPTSLFALGNRNNKIDGKIVCLVGSGCKSIVLVPSTAVG